MRITVCRALGVALALLLVPVIAGAQATVEKTNTRESPFEAVLFIPCALDGAGENVIVSGVIHFTEHIVIDGNGDWHYRWQGNPQGLTGLGEDSGEVYHFTGKTSYVEKGSALPYTASFVNNFHVIGGGANFKVWTRYHITIRPDGETAVEIDYEDVTCQ